MNEVERGFLLIGCGLALIILELTGTELNAVILIASYLMGLGTRYISSGRRRH